MSGGLSSPEPEDGKKRPPRVSPSAATIPPEMWHPEPQPGAFTCSRCDEWWTARNAAHCGGCCETFASVPLFDSHRSQEGEHGACIPPAQVEGRNGERRLFFRAGMWRGPEMSPEKRAEMVERWAS